MRAEMWFPNQAGSLASSREESEKTESSIDSAFDSIGTDLRVPGPARGRPELGQKGALGGRVQPLQAYPQ